MRPIAIASHLFGTHIARMDDPYSAEAIAEIARLSVASLPREIRESCVDVPITVEDFATPAQLASVGLIDRWTLSGLYEGVPLPNQSTFDTGRMPARVWLFRMPILAEMRSRRVSLENLVHHVVVHEFGHHFGFSDDDMHALEHQLRS